MSSMYHDIGPGPRHEETVAHLMLGNECPCQKPVTEAEDHAEEADARLAACAECGGTDPLCPELES